MGKEFEFTLLDALTLSGVLGSRSASPRLETVAMVPVYISCRGKDAREHRAI